MLLHVRDCIDIWACTQVTPSLNPYWYLSMNLCYSMLQLALILEHEYVLLYASVCFDIWAWRSPVRPPLGDVGQEVPVGSGGLLQRPNASHSAYPLSFVQNGWSDPSPSEYWRGSYYAFDTMERLYFCTRRVKSSDQLSSRLDWPGRVLSRVSVCHRTLVGSSHTQISGSYQTTSCRLDDVEPETHPSRSG